MKRTYRVVRKNGESKRYIAIIHLSIFQIKGVRSLYMQQHIRGKQTKEISIPLDEIDEVVTW
jgi:hypothetical protein